MINHIPVRPIDYPVLWLRVVGTLRQTNLPPRSTCWSSRRLLRDVIRLPDPPISHTAAQIAVPSSIPPKLPSYAASRSAMVSSVMGSPLASGALIFEERNLQLLTRKRDRSCDECRNCHRCSRPWLLCLSKLRYIRPSSQDHKPARN